MPSTASQVEEIQISVQLRSHTNRQEVNCNMALLDTIGLII